MHWFAWLAIAGAQDAPAGRDFVAASSVAAENGPGAAFVNAANHGFDNDGYFGVFLLSQGEPTPLGEAQPVAVAATFGGRGLHLGVRRAAGTDNAPWAIDSGFSAALPQRFAFGAMSAWDIRPGARNSLSYGLSAGWRPHQALGVSAGVADLDIVSEGGPSQPTLLAGIASAPLGRPLVLGVDWIERLRTSDLSGERRFAATARLRPVPGCYVRVGATLGAVDGVALTGVTGGLELFQGGFGAGGYLRSDLNGGLASTLFVGSDEPDESLVRTPRTVPTLSLDDSPEYQPRALPFTSRDASWLEVLEGLERLAADKHAQGLLLKLDGAGLSSAKAIELRDGVRRLRERGKSVHVYLHGSPSNHDYLVASAANAVWMHPAGTLGLKGYAATVTNARGLLDWVGVEPQFVGRGKYKSGPEQFTHDAPSTPALEQLDALLDDLHDALVEGIVAGRAVDADAARGWIDGGPYTAEEAIDLGLVDALLYPDELDDKLEQLLDGSVSRPKLATSAPDELPWEVRARIAVLFVEGSITSGTSSRGGLLRSRSTGSDTVLKQLDRVRKDDEIKAVVLRVDSPGGSAFASEEIWRAVERVKRVGKPVVVSMGGVAASGGYYVSAGADAIWAEPTTITGSIGVYTGKFSQRELFERLGVGQTTLARGRHATIDSAALPWDEAQRARMQAVVDQTYAMFKERVAKGRGLSEEQVETIAQGRVWSGEAAVDNGLVDQLGGLPEAIADARARAEISERRRVELITFTSAGPALSTVAPAIAQAWTGPVDPRSPLAHTLDALGVTAWQLGQPDGTVWALSPWHLSVDGAE